MQGPAAAGDLMVEGRNDEQGDAEGEETKRGKLDGTARAANFSE